MKANPCQRYAASYGDMRTEIPLIILLAEYRGTKDSLQKIGERHGANGRAMPGCNRVLAQLGIKRASAPRWHAGPRPERRDPWAWRGVELDVEARHWAAYDRTQTAAALVASAKGLSVQGGHYHLNHEAGKERSRLAARARHARLKETPEWKIRQGVRNAIRRIVKATGIPRKPKSRSQEYLGCSYADARARLTPLLAQGMTWDNHGTVWEIDHKRPLASFDLTDEAQRKRACHWTNLQPLLKADNRAKGDRWEEAG